MKRKRFTRLSPQRQQVVLSLERTLLSKERTVLAEITVLLAAVGLGFVIIRIFQGTVNEWLEWVGALIIGSAFAGIAMLVFSFKRHSKKQKELESENYIKIK